MAKILPNQKSRHIDATSISTNDIKRDGHLKSADFLDVENHKEISFEGTSFVQLNDKISVGRNAYHQGHQQ